MINTLNESHLHRTLKKIYSLQNDGSREECNVGPYIADILTKKGDVIEIQTGSLSHLLPKIRYFLDEKRKITVVYPIATQTTIVTTNPKSGEKKSRKSPVRRNIYDIFRDIAPLIDVLFEKKFTLEVLDVTILDERETTETAVQSKNGRRRRLKNWIKTGKSLEKIESTRRFHAKRDYLKLIPAVPEKFTYTDIYQSIVAAGTKVKAGSLRYMLWLYNRMGLIEITGKQGRFNLYSLTKNEKIPSGK